MSSSSQLVEILQEEKAATASDLQRLVREQKETGAMFAELLISSGVITEEELVYLLARRTSLPVMPESRLLHLSITPELRRRVSRATASQSRLVPIDWEPLSGSLSLVMLDPTDLNVIDMVKRSSGAILVNPYIGRRSAIMTAIEAIYSAATESEDDESRTNIMIVDGMKAQVARPTRPITEELRTEEQKVALDPMLAREIAAMKVPPKSEADTGAWKRPPITPAIDVSSSEIEGIGEQELQAPPLLLQTAPDHLATDENTDPFLSLPAPEPEPGQIQDQEVVDQILSNTLEISSSDLDSPPTGRTEDSCVTKVTITGRIPRLISEDDMSDLSRQLFSSINELISIIEEQLATREKWATSFAKLAKIVASEMGLDEFAVERISLAAQIYGLCRALLEAKGQAKPTSVISVFGLAENSSASMPLPLRSLGALVLQLKDERDEQSLGVRLIQVIADYLELRAETSDAATNWETLAQLLRAGGADPQIIEALQRALPDSELSPVLTSPDEG